MVDFKNILSPKFIFPVVGICVLVVVAALVAVFYIRNPTVTDNLFANQETTGAPDDDFKTTGVPSQYTGNNGIAGSYSIDQKSPAPAVHDTKGHETHVTTLLMSTLLSTTSTHSSIVSTEPHPIEPVKHE